MIQSFSKRQYQPSFRVPESLEQALDRVWLSWALAPVSSGAKVASVTLTEEVKAMASKLRIAVRFENAPDVVHHFCLKAFLDSDQDRSQTGLVTLREARFYQRIAPKISMRVPACANVITDEAEGQAIIVMEDLLSAGASFCDALHPLSVEQVETTLDQLARLHARSDLLNEESWVEPRLPRMAESPQVTAAWLQQQMRDGRGEGLSAATVDAALLKKALQALSARSEAGRQTLLHGDSHIANIYFNDDGPGFADWQLVNRGNWALDVAYHIVLALPAELAASEERRLLEHYGRAVVAHGGSALSPESAWDDYCCALPYGFYLWAITSRVDPQITRLNFQRLGAAIERNASYRKLGVIA